MVPNSALMPALVLIPSVEPLRRQIALVVLVHSTGNAVLEPHSVSSFAAGHHPVGCHLAESPLVEPHLSTYGFADPGVVRLEVGPGESRASFSEPVDR